MHLRVPTCQPLHAAPIPWHPSQVSKVVPVRQADSLLPAARQRRHPPADRRRLSGVQRGPARRGVSDLHRQDAGAKSHDTTIGLTIAGALTPAGLGGCIIELMERGLVDFIISTGANLYHDLHYALNFTLHRGSPFLDDRVLYEQGVIRIYDVLFPAKVLLDTDAFIRDFLIDDRARRAGVDRGVPLRTRRAPAPRAARLRGVLGRRQRREVRRADLHLVAGRQLDRHERRLSRADARRHADDRSEQGRQRDLRHHPRRREERLRDSRRRLAEELLPPGTADAVGGLRHPQGRQRLLHPDHDRSGRLGRPVRARRRPKR